MGIKMAGTGMYVPDLQIDNMDFSKFVETSDEWITTRTGIKKRHFTNGELGYQLGTKAAQQALDNAQMDINAVDMILVCTCSPDFFTPSVACMIGKELGATKIPAMDLNVACAGFIFALDVAEKYLNSGMKNILIVATEIISRMIDYQDRSTCVLFGDGAAAVVVQSSSKLYQSFLSGKLDDAHKIFAKLPAPDHPFGKNTSDYGDDKMNETEDFHIMMAGNDVYKFATAAMPEAILAVTKQAGIEVDELSWLIPHQANIRIIETALKKMKFPKERCYVNISDFGNISSSCIPLALAQLDAKNQLKKGDKIGLVGFGAGLVYGAVVFEW